MGDKQKELDQENARLKLEESAARLRLLKAKAEGQNAEVAMAEISGLTSLEAGIRKQFEEWKHADQEAWHQIKHDIQSGIDILVRHANSADERLNRLDEADERRIDAEMNQLDAAVDVLTARAGQAWVADKKIGTKAIQDLKDGWAQIQEKRRELQSSAKQGSAKTRAAFQKQLDSLKRKCTALAKKLQPPEEGAAHHA